MTTAETLAPKRPASAVKRLWLSEALVSRRWQGGAWNRTSLLARHRNRGILAVVSASLCAAFSLVLAIWGVIPQGLVTGIDGRLLLALVEQARDFGVPWHTTNVNALQGAFNLAFPFNSMLSSTLPMVLLPAEPARFWTSVLSLGAYAVGILAVARAVGVGIALLPIAVALPVALQVYPFQHEVGASLQFVIMPGCFLSIGLFSLILAIVLSAGDGARAMLASYAAVLVLTLWVIAAEPLWAAVNGAFFAPFVAMAVFAKGRAGFRHGAVLLAMAALLWFAGPLEYLYALLVGNARTMLNVEFTRGEAGQVGSASAIFASAFALQIHGFVIAALAAGVFLPRRRLRVLCALGLPLMLGFYLLVTYFLGAAERWPLPLPIYFETATLHVPIALALAVVRAHSALAFAGLGDALARLRLAGLANLAMLLPALAVPAAALWYLVQVAPQRTTIYIDRFAAAAGVGAAVKEARAARPVAAGPPGAVAVFGLAYHSAGRKDDTFNIFHYVLGHLWRQQVPTMNEYSQMVTPVSHLLVTRLAPLAEPTVVINGLSIGRYHENLFRLFGVEFVLAGQPQQGRSLVLLGAHAFGAGERNRALLYRVVDFESPLRPALVRPVKDLGEAIARLADPAFDVREEVLLDASPAGPWRRADRAAMRHASGRLKVEVYSLGRSVVVLPVQFSNCWRVMEGDPARLLRANGGFLAVVTEGAARFTLGFTMSIWSPGCRRADMRDWARDIAALDLADRQGASEPPGATTLDRLRAAMMTARW